MPNVSFIFRFDVQDYNIDKVKLLIDNGANVNCKDSYGWTPIHIATTTLHWDLLNILVKHKVDVNAKMANSVTPVLLITSQFDELEHHRRFEILKFLLFHGADPNIAGGNHKRTAFHEAASDQMVDVMELLIFHGAEVNTKDDQLRTPLHFAARNVQPEAVKLLMKHGADPHAKDQNGWTPFDYLRQRIITDTEVDSYKVFEMILE